MSKADSQGGLNTVLLVTATKIESEAVLAAVGISPGVRILNGVPLYELGVIGSSRAWLAQSEIGASTPGGSLISIHNAIRVLSPAAVYMVGIAFGTRDSDQDIGDVLVSRQLFAYEHVRVGTDQAGATKRVTRGDRVTASPSLLRRLRIADLSWKGQRVHFGLMLSGEKLVDNLDLRDQLIGYQPEAVGGEMEGVGLYVAAVESGVDWIIVKGICDWADGNKALNKDERQLKAAQSAICFVIHALQLPSTDCEAKTTISSRRFAGTLIGLSVVAWAIGFLRISDSLATVSSVVIVAAIVGYVTFSRFARFSRLKHALAGQLANQRQRLAIARLRRVLTRLLSTDPTLLTANGVRSMARGIQQDLKAPPINEFVIAEVVRAIALEILESPRGRDVTRAVGILNHLLVELGAISKEKPPLMTIAQTDPVSAYMHSTPVASAISLLGLSAIVFVVSIWIPLELVKLSPVLQAAISGAGLILFCRTLVSVERVLTSGPRAHTYWENVTAGSDSETVHVLPSLDPIVDSFPFITVSDASAVIRRFSTTWSPIWETIHTFAGPREFGKMHEYRYFQARPYAHLLKRAYGDASQYQRAGKVVPEYTLAEIQRLTRRMWVFTGQSEYRVAYEDAKNGVINRVGGNGVSHFVASRGRRARFGRLHRQVQAYLVSGTAKPSDHEIQEYEDLCNELGEMTGESGYRAAVKSLRADLGDISGGPPHVKN